MPIVKVVGGTCVKEEIKDNEKRGRESRDTAKKMMTVILSSCANSTKKGQKK